MINHASLFSGIVGFDLAAEWAGFENVFTVEIDEFCNKVIEKNFPNTKRFKNIYEFDGTKYRGQIDIISGGFPCQSFSVAGKRKGTEDDRYLWPEMLRIISEIRPSWVIAENVYGLLNIENGLVFEQVLSDLENQGYEVQPFIIPASAKNADHRRDRVWIVANNEEQRKRRIPISERDKNQNNDTNRQNCDVAHTNTETTKCQRGGITWTGRNGFANGNNDVAHTNDKRLQREFGTNGKERPGIRYKQFAGRNREWENDWPEVATSLCGMDDGIPGRVDRLKALGNAIVPQIAYEIFKIIKHIEGEIK